MADAWNDRRTPPNPDKPWIVRLWYTAYYWTGKCLTPNPWRPQDRVPERLFLTNNSYQYWVYEKDVYSTIPAAEDYYLWWLNTYCPGCAIEAVWEVIDPDDGAVYNLYHAYYAIPNDKICPWYNA